MNHLAISPSDAEHGHEWMDRRYGYLTHRFPWCQPIPRMLRAVIRDPLSLLVSTLLKTDVLTLRSMHSMLLHHKHAATCCCLFASDSELVNHLLSFYVFLTRCKMSLIISSDTWKCAVNSLHVWLLPFSMDNLAWWISMRYIPRPEHPERMRSSSFINGVIPKT